MCGRFVRHTNAAELTRLVGALLPVPDPGPSYNVAPSQPILNARERDGQRVLEPLQWGLVPRWAKDARKLHPINARAETVDTNGVFRAAFRGGRTLIPADGFYEWRRTEAGKQPYFITRSDGRPMWFAGVADRWRGPEGTLETCAIITTAANDAVRPLHDRMPVILDESHWDQWLDPRHFDAEALQALLQPCDPGLLTLYPVSRAVSSPANDSPSLVDALEA
ncbi:SOS response-associated peptidase [Ectothiorhodospiraceae bacterium WFHF3C12]|nr:SOS response-associated peptidase [Ectothiorhodospiraceae bacterium WFHF3C12]